MKILHCADLHLGRRPVGGVGKYSQLRYEDYFVAFKKCAELAIKENVKVIIISGDLFDRRDLTPEILERTEEILNIISQNGIQIIITEGNHDNIMPGKENESWIIYLEKKGYLKHPKYYYQDTGFHFLPISIDGVSFYGLGYPGSLVNETLTALSESISNNKNENIILVHTAIASEDFLPGTVKKQTIDLFKNKAIYIAGGHFHSYQFYPNDEPIFFVPGSPEYWDINEATDKKGFIIFDTEEKKFSFIKSNPRNKIEINFQSKSDNQKNFEEEFSYFINNINYISEDDIVIININLSKPFYINTSQYEDFLLKKGVLKAIIKLNLRFYAEDKSFINYIPTIQKVEKEIISSWEIFSHFTDKILETLQKLKDYQRENQKEQFLECLDNMLNLVSNYEQKNENK